MLLLSSCCCSPLTAPSPQVFLAADADCNGILDVAEFTALLKQICPKARSAAELQQARLIVAKERLHARLAQLAGDAPVPEAASCTFKVVVLGASRAGKTYLLNQVLSEKLPKGKTLSVGFGTLSLKIGMVTVAVQARETTRHAAHAGEGGGRASAASVRRRSSTRRATQSSRRSQTSSSPPQTSAALHTQTRSQRPSARGGTGPRELALLPAGAAILMFDATSLQSFEAVGAYRDAFLEANPQYDDGRVLLLSNVARLGVKRAVSAGFAGEWTARHSPMTFFELTEDNPQGILDPLRYAATEYLFLHGEDLEKG